MKLHDILLEAGAVPVYYFAYGMLTDPELMPGANLIGSAELKNFKLEMFAYANVFPTPGATVIGSLWAIDRQLLAQLDNTEDYPTLYDRKTVPVFANGQRYEAELYTMTPGTRDYMVGKLPSEGYIQRIERGYQNAGIPFDQLDDALDAVYDDLNEDMTRRGFLGALAAGAASAAGAANSRVAPAKPVKPAAAPIETTGLSMNSTPEHMVQRVAIQSGIKGAELAQFMAQTRHESADFSRMKEIGGAKYFHSRYDPSVAPQTARILGNTRPGDGVRYFGRGFIQITGRDNYKRAGEALGLPLEQHPELAARPDVAAKIAVWFWKMRVKPNVQNFNDTTAVTKLINPALRGLQDRLQHFKDYKMVMNVR